MSSAAGPSKCPGCAKTVYAHDKPLKACGGEWHALCLKCTQCKTTLNLSTFQSYTNQPYCKVHVPKDKPTQVADAIVTKNAISVPKAAAVQGVEKTQTNSFPTKAPSRTGPNSGGYMGIPSPSRGPTRTSAVSQGVLPQRVATPLTSVKGGPAPSRGPPMKGAPAPSRPPTKGAAPVRSWKIETENPPSMGPGKATPPSRTQSPTPTRNAPPPQRTGPVKTTAPPTGGAKKWNIEASSSVPHSPSTFKPSSDPSKAPDVVVGQSVSSTPFKTKIEHKAEMKRISVVPTKEISTMQKTTNVGKQPVGIMYSSSDSEDEEREKLHSTFKQQNYHGKGYEDQSTENAPNPSTIKYDSRSHDQTTENRPMTSSITYDKHNPDQSTESRPPPSAIKYESHKADQSTGGYSQSHEENSYVSNEGGYVEEQQEYTETSYTEQGYEQTEQAYEQTYEQQGYEEQTEQGYEQQGYEQQGYEEQGYEQQGYEEQGYAEQGYEGEGTYTEGYGEQEYSEQGYYEEGTEQQGW